MLKFVIFLLSTPLLLGGLLRGQQAPASAPVLRPSDKLNQFLKEQAAGLPEAFRPVIGQDEFTHASTISIGGHSIAVEPLSLYPWSGKGPAFAGMKLEAKLDGKFSPQLTVKGLEFGKSPEEASEKIYSHWWRAQAVPMLGFLLNNPPALTMGDAQIWTPAVPAGAAVKGSFPATVANHKKLLQLAAKEIAALPPGQMQTAVISRQKQPPFTLSRNWDGGWLVDEKSAKKPKDTLPICSYALSAGSDPAHGKAMEKLMLTEKVTEEFAYGYIILRKAP